MKAICFFLLSFFFSTFKVLFAQQPPAPVVISSYTKNLPPVFFGYNGNNVIGKDDGGNFLSFSVDELRNTLPQLHSTIIRFPAGGKAKSWDWNEGWHLDHEVLFYESNVPNYIDNICVKQLDKEEPPINGSVYQGNQLTALKGAWNMTGAAFIIPLNLISSNKDYQLEQVRQAYNLMKKLTVNDTVFIELGNEVYNKSDPAVKCLFPEPENYLETANEYLDAFHNSSFFPGENIKVSVGVIAAATSVQDKSLTLDCHYNTWNAELGLPFTGTSGNDRLHLKKQDALIFHIYPESGLTVEENHIPSIDPLDGNDEILFQIPFDNIAKMMSNELKAVPPGINAWVSEFNLSDEKSVYVRGTWAHALFTALQALTFLEAPSISKIICHDLINDSGRSSVFSKSNGFSYATECDALEQCTTGVYKLTAQGMALNMVAEAMKKSIKAQQINFAADFGAYTFANGRCKLHGWQFTKKDATGTDYNETIILNLGNTAQTIRLSGLYSSPGTSAVYESIYPSANHPFVYVTNNTTMGEAYEVSSGCSLTQSNLVINEYTQYNSSLVIQPYSIVHIKKANLASTSVAVFPAKTIDVCAGENVHIFASGAASYEWDYDASTSLTLLNEEGQSFDPQNDKESTIIVSNVTSNGTLKVKMRNGAGTNLGTETITINVKSKPAQPTLSVTQPAVTNSCVAVLNCSTDVGNKILWWPSTGIMGDYQDLSAATINAKPLHPTTYHNVLINSDGCYYESEAEKVSFNNNKALIDDFTEPCFGDDVSLAVLTSCTGCTYAWTSSTGLSGTGNTFPVNDIDKTTSVFLTRTDNTACAAGDSKTIKVNPEFDAFQREFSACHNECVRLKFQMKNSDQFFYDWENAEVNASVTGTSWDFKAWQPSGETCDEEEALSFCSPQAAFKADIGGNTLAVFEVKVRVYETDCEDPCEEEACTTSCFNEATFTITVSKPAEVSVPAYVEYCAGGYGAANIDLPSGSKLVFLDGTGFDQATYNEIMVKPNVSNPTYEFTVINENGCCSHDYEIDFVQVDCCNSTIDGISYTYMNPTSQSLIYNLALKGLQADWISGEINFTTSLGKKLAINGELKLSGALKLVEAADVTFADEAKINLNGYSLTLVRSTLYSCDGTNMWNGITNNGNNASGLIITGSSTEYSKIKDAVTGAEFTGGGVLQIEFAEFDNNHIDLSILNFCSGLASSDYIRDCKFLNTAGASLKAPYNGQQKYAAIAFYKTDGGTIGSTTTGANVFDGGDHGLQVTKSKLTLLNNDFSNFTNSGGQGYAIYHSSVGSGAGDCTGTSAFVKVGDGTTGGANTFTDCDYGVYSKSARLTIDFNTFTNVPRSIYVEGSSGKQLVIQNNTLDAAELGISLLQTQASSITVFNNDIELSGLSSTGDYYGIKQADNGSAINSTIEDNVVSIEDNANCKAIFIQASSGVQLINNTIYWNFTGTCGSPCPSVYGLRLENSSDCFLDCNHISGTSTIAAYIEGKRSISLSYSPSCTLTCNTTDKFKSGLEFLADCNNALIQGNTLNAHKYGMLLGYETIEGVVVEGVVGDQEVSGGFAPGNRYQGNNNSGNFLGSGYGLYRYLSSGTNPPNIIFDVLSNTTTDFYTTSSASNKSNGAIQQSPQEASSFACDENCQSTLREGDEGIFTDSLLANFETIAADSAEEGSTYEVIVWSMQKNVYEDIIYHPQLQDSSEVLSEFMEETGIATTGKLVMIEHLMLQLSDTTLTDEIFELKHDSTSLLLAAIETEKIFEQNAKNVYTIYLGTLLSGIDTFTEEQKSDLYSVAIQCPYYGGPAVYNARAIYSLINDSASYNDEELCALQEQTVKYERPSSALKGKFTMDVYPNPTDDIVAVRYHVSELNTARFQLTDTYGRILIKEEVSKSSGTEFLSLKALPSGIYHLALIAEEHVVCTSKIFKTN